MFQLSINPSLSTCYGFQNEVKTQYNKNIHLTISRVHMYFLCIKKYNRKKSTRSCFWFFRKTNV